MRLSRVLMGRVAGVAACFTLVALGGCGSSVAAKDAGNGDGANTDGGRTLDDASRSDGGGALPDAANVDGGVARGDALAMAIPLPCVDGEWCPELPSNFVDVLTLVGNQPVATIENRVYVLRANEWTRVVCPADSGTSDPPVLFTADSNVTIARCGTRRYRWSADGFAPIDWPAGAVEQSEGVFGLPDVVFSIAQRDGNRFVARCTDRGCDTINLNSPDIFFPLSIFARSADEFWVFDGSSTAWRHTDVGWSSVPAEFVPRPPALRWPPEVDAECLRDGRWVLCTRTRLDVGPFRRHVRTRSAVIAATPLGEEVLYDGATTQRLRSVTPFSFVLENWPEILPEVYQWAGPIGFDVIRDGADDRLFMLFAVGLLGEGNGGHFPVRQKIYTRLGNGPWGAVPGGEFNSSLRPSFAASSPSSLWVLDGDGLRHLARGSWSTVAGRYWGLCPLSDGSTIAQGANAVTHVSVTGELGAATAARAVLACTHDDAWIQTDSSIMHWSGGAWVAVPDPPIAAASREFGRSDLGATVRNRDGSTAYVWDGSAWQRRDEANASFFVDPHRARFADREWKLVYGPSETLLYRDRR